MSAHQPFVSALSVCGPAVGKIFTPFYDSSREADEKELFSDSKNIPQQKIISSSSRGAGGGEKEKTSGQILSAKENMEMEELLRQTTPASSMPTSTKLSQNQLSSQQLPPISKNISAKKNVGVVSQKPPFLVGKAPLRNNLAIIQKSSSANGGGDNRAEIAELKKQIGELSHLLRQHVEIKKGEGNKSVEKKITETKTAEKILENTFVDNPFEESQISKRDIGTDPIIFDNFSDSSTNTDSSKLCSNCQKKITSAARAIANRSSSPIKSIIEGSSPDRDTSLCSQLESLAMQYLSDDQLATIALGNNSSDTTNNKPLRQKEPKQRSQEKQLHQQRFDSAEFSPPKRRAAAVAPKRENANTISPNFGNVGGGGLMLTRRHCITTTEHQVSIFGGGSGEPKGVGVDSLPFGVSVASQDFLQRHRVLDTGSSRQPMRQTRNSDFEDDQPNRYNQQGRMGDYHRNNYDASVVGPPRYNYNPQQRRDAAPKNVYYEEQWD